MAPSQAYQPCHFRDLISDDIGIVDAETDPDKLIANDGIAKLVTKANE